MSAATSRKGSALLIVLGMLSFMVISAVAFSAYMRSSRLPSSYLRRVTSSRLLLKAAFAEAIDEIDAAVGDFPHPGVWMDRNNLNAGANRNHLTRSQHREDIPPGERFERSPIISQNDINANVWLGRVYIGNTNAFYTRAEQCLLPQDETVSTLSMEALAYIPPPLVNEARYYSRHSNAATWHSLPFDAGRYAFTAIDVSDYFDINALTAGDGRNSSPAGRISLSYLFENLDHTSAGSQGDAWDTFIGGFLNDVPLISVADWNLAMGSQQFGNKMKSYFYNYAKKGSSQVDFYNGEAVSDDDRELVGRMTFVTDGWFPQIKEANAPTTYDLADPLNQPFTMAALENESPNFYGVMEDEAKGVGAQRLLQYVPNIALATLYDYLDFDHIPLSLSIPTTERVPMICGIEPNFNGASIKIADPQVGTSYEPPESESGDFQGTSRTATKTVVIRLDGSGFGTPGVSFMAVYPFRHQDNVNAASYKLQSRAALFFTTDEMGLRPANAVASLLCNEEPKWNSSDAISDNAVMNLKFSNEQGLSFSSVGTPEEAVKDNLAMVVAPNSLGDINSGLQGGYELLNATFKWTQTRTKNDDGTFTPWTPEFAAAYGGNQVDVKAVCNMRALAKDGRVDGTLTKTDKSLVDALMAGVNLRLNLAVWARIKDTENKTVDLVPACGQDDKLNGSSNWDHPQSHIILQDYFGAATPLMRFDTGVVLSLKLDGDCNLDQNATSPQQISITPKAVLAGDPRFNYAPENWFAWTGGGINKNTWLQENGADANDGDIFMQVSDQGYLQSVFELANIVRFGNNGFGQFGDQVIGNLNKPTVWQGTAFPQNRGDTANSGQMWRTYDPFGKYLDGGDKFDDLRFCTDGVGFKVNPYSDSTNIILAALANTPHDWRVASTNNEEIGQQNDGTIDAKDFNQKYAWNEYSSGAKLAWSDCERMAANIMEGMKGAGASWEDVWDDLWDWKNQQGNTGSDYLCGTQLEGSSDDLYNTDKKFLYGYWRECFAVRQQLYLVFVRVEPMFMGGGSVSQTPPQLGARGVALVWRDPLSRDTEGQNYPKPHRTRILFYRQFD